MVYSENALTYENYRALRESVGWLNFSEEQTRAALKNSLFDVVAQDNGRAAGMGRLIGDGLYYTVADVVIRPEYQGRGIGRSILQRLLDYVEKNVPAGGRASVLLIAAQGKEPFYEKMGFRRIPHEHSGSGMRRIFCRE